MGSQHMYRAYASYLLGRPPKCQDELDSMNLRVRGSAVQTWRTSGYGQNFYQQCAPSGHLFRAFCVAGMGSPRTNLKTIRKFPNKHRYLSISYKMLIINIWAQVKRRTPWCTRTIMPYSWWSAVSWAFGVTGKFCLKSRRFRRELRRKLLMWFKSLGLIHPWWLMQNTMISLALFYSIR